MGRSHANSIVRRKQNRLHCHPQSASLGNRMFLALVTLCALSACGSDGQPVATDSGSIVALPLVSAPSSPAGSTSPQSPPAGAPSPGQPAQTPPPITNPLPAPAGQNGAVQLAPIPSNFDVSSELVPSWGNGNVAPFNTGDIVGAFRFICNPGHLAWDDPIVYPGQPGKSHLHQFFGNTKSDANSTYASLRTTGESTCNNKLNRSAYWTPAMLNGKGGVVRPDYYAIYYKRYPADSPKCKEQGKECRAIPRGLRYVFGYDMAKPKEWASGYFNCDGPGAEPGHYDDIPTAMSHCPIGARMGAVISAPDCWNGKDLDSPNHRDHMAYASWGNNGVYRCPATHPYVIPAFTIGAWYAVDADKATWRLSSDDMMPGLVSGTTLHADWFGAWDDTVLDMWTNGCINKQLNCSGGDLGNGKQLKMFDGFKWVAEPHVVPVPAKG